jgi:hypothetical protein
LVGLPLFVSFSGGCIRRDSLVIVTGYAATDRIIIWKEVKRALSGLRSRSVLTSGVIQASPQMSVWAGWRLLASLRSAVGVPRASMPELLTLVIRVGIERKSGMRSKPWIRGSRSTDRSGLTVDS